MSAIKNNSLAMTKAKTSLAFLLFEKIQLVSKSRQTSSVYLGRFKRYRFSNS